MTVSVSNEDDDEEDKRFAFSPSFVKIRCEYRAPAAGNVMDLSFHWCTPPAPGTGSPRTQSVLMKNELISL